MAESKFKEIHERITARSARICILGLGYVGLPTALAFSELGFYVAGIDISAKKIAALRDRKSPIPEVPITTELATRISSGQLEFYDHVPEHTDCDIYLIVVPTPLQNETQPDLQFVRAAARSIAKQLQPGNLVILESTTYPGTTREIVGAEIEAAGFQLGSEIGLAYCPERYNPGDKDHTLSDVTRVVGGYNADWTEVAASLYGTLNNGNIHRVSSMEAAEASKVIENTQRDLNIALVNEFALIFDRMGIDTFEVLEAAATKWNFIKFLPGIGVGGHCLPVDPYYLTHVAQRHGYVPKVILAGREVNNSMPSYVANRLVRGLNAIEESVKGQSIIVFGIAYKPNTADARESPAVKLIEALHEFGPTIHVVDPHIDDDTIRTLTGCLPAKSDALPVCDVAIICTPHEEFGEGLIDGLLATKPKLVVDATNANGIERLRAAGIPVESVGRIL